MRCPKCGFNTNALDIYKVLDLPEEHAERKRWQENSEHRKTLEFYAWFISAFQQARLLDVGSGPGTVAIPLSRLDNVTEVICFDHDIEAQKTLKETKTRENLEKIQITTEGEPWALPFGADSFDIIICRYAMHHFANQLGAICDMHRCLRPGGVLLYSDPAMPEHSRDTTHGLYLLRQDSFHGYRTYHEMIDLVTEQGFQVLAVRPYNYQRGTLDDYLKETGNELKEPLIRAWCGLDEKSKQELKWSGQREGPFITYSMIDIAARKDDA